MLDPGFMSQSLTSFHHFHLRWRLPLFFTAFIQRICSHDTCTIADKTLRQSTCFFCHCSFKNKTALFACPSGTWQHIYAWLWIFYFWKKMALRITSASPGFIQSLSQEMEGRVPIREPIVIFPESWDQQVYFSLRSISRHFSETQVMLNIQTWLSSRPHIDLHQCSEPEHCFDLRPKLSFDLNGVRSRREAKPALI